MNHRMRYYDDPILRQRSDEIKEVTQEVRELADFLVRKMYEHKGIGLAAPQMGILQRIFVICVDHEDEEGEVILGEPRVFINPILSNFSQEMVERNEGCLSIPGLVAPVMRPLALDIEATDLSGNRFTVKGCWGFLARAMMHETDHLDGILFVDRIKGRRRTQIEPFLRKIKKEYNNSL